MEKGNTRSSSASKSNNSDAKNKDVTSKYLRLPRYKDCVSPRPETRRKPNPQRSRELFDKRPRNRSGAICERYRNEIAEETVSEPLTKQGCKKMNLNHLLNFTLAPIESREGNGRRGNYNRIKLPKYNKELFLQANCQFVARGNGNYSVHQKNPDILVEWPLIEEICLPSHEVPLCPICLFCPTAAKITRCGHIYCWPCILHYLALTDKTWQKCPICFEAVHKTDLKSVSFRLQKPFSVGDEITMCLMKREKGSLLPSPVTHESPVHVCNVDDDDSVTRFQKLLLADTKDILSIINRERSELEEAYSQEKDNPEACFIESALKLLKERENDLNNEETLTVTSVEKNELESSTVVDIVSSRTHHESVSSTESHDESFALEMSENSSCLEALSEKSVSIGAIATSTSNDSEKKTNSFFYQAEDGQHIYLHNLNVRMLLKEFGSLEHAPLMIKAKIVEIERVSMTEVLRRRLRYLQHLPLTCEFQVVELNFSHLLPKSTLLHFESEIIKRRHHRNMKARDERRREKYIQQEENKKLGKYPKATYNLRSIDQFPVYHQNDFPSQPVSKNENTEDNPLYESPGLNFNCGSPPLPGCISSVDTETVPTTSFAQMLKDGPKTFTQAPKEIKKPAPAVMQSTQPNADSDGEEWVPPPEYHQSFSDAIQAALDSVTIQDSPSNNQKSSKKKKAKKQLLFTTSMCRNK